MKILVFGNPLVKQDSIALRMIPYLQKKFPDIEFKEFDAAENLEDEGRDLIILDSAEGIGHAVLIESLDLLGSANKYSMHDFDLSLTLKILKKMGAVDSVKLIAIPSNYPLRKALKEAEKIIASLSS